MVTPAYLKKSDHVAIIASARKVTVAEIEPAIIKLQEWGLSVVPGKHLLGSFHQFAGMDQERMSDFQSMLDDSAIRAIFCARGGYGTVRIIDGLDFSRFAKNPKWIIGYSDATVLHSHIHTNFGIETLHATMPCHFSDLNLSAETYESLRQALFGEPLAYTLPSSPLSRKGKANGVVVGGNLSLLYSLSGTHSDLFTSGKILLLEDLDEYLYHLDRMMMNLKRSGKLSRLAGLIVGGMTGMKDNRVPFGLTAEEIIAEAVKKFDYPVCFGFPSGHIPDNRALYLGRKAELIVDHYTQLRF